MKTFNQVHKPFTHYPLVVFIQVFTWEYQLGNKTDKYIQSKMDFSLLMFQMASLK